MNILIISIICITALALEAPYKMLVLPIYPGCSHYVIFEVLFRELARKGHVIDIVNHFPQKKQLSGFTDLSIRGTMELTQNNLSFAATQTSLKTTNDNINYILGKLGIGFCDIFLDKKPQVALDIRNSKKKYDLIVTHILGTDCTLGFAYHFKAPVISITPSSNMPWGGCRIGNPDTPSYIPNYFASFRLEMRFIQRLYNTLTLLYSQVRYSIAQRTTTINTRKFFGHDLPDLKKLSSNTSMFFVNSHYSLNFARPSVPNFVEVAGLHIHPIKPLPQKLEQLLNTSTLTHKGIIYFSMGSMLYTESLPREMLLALMDTFSELPYKILWKAAKERMPQDLNIPTNIHFESWLPQSDVLCHPNVKLFISHGGLMGTQEATLCGVPCLGIPLFADHAFNLKAIENHGLGLTINLENVNKKTLLTAAKELLYNKKFKDNAKTAAQRFRDRPHSPLDIAIYWVEYVIRHNGAHHLRSVAAELPWYQYHMLDVIGFLILGIIATICIVYKFTLIFLNELSLKRVNYIFYSSHTKK